MTITKITKQIILGVAFAAFISVPATARASEDTYVCGQSYGQPVVCGVKVPQEEALIVKAGLKEDLRLIGLVLITGSFALYVKGKRIKEASFDEAYLR